MKGTVTIPEWWAVAGIAFAALMTCIRLFQVWMVYQMWRKKKE